MALCGSCMAQAQFRIGVKAGLGAAYQSKYQLTDAEKAAPYFDNYLNGSKAAYYLGVSADWALGKHISIQPSLLYSSKGSRTGTKTMARADDMIFQVDITGENRLNYLELPLNILYKQKLGKGKIFAGAGLYGALYLNGHKEGDFLIRENPKIKDPLPKDGSSAYEGRLGPLYNGNQADAKVWDSGINFTAGYELPQGLQIALNYSSGFNETYYGKNRVYSLSVSYYLHKK